MRPALVITIAYLLGSIPFGYLIVRATAGDDIRETGSGGTGATNVSRRAGKLAGVATLILDALKGAVAVLIAKSAVPALLTGDISWEVAGASVAVMLGHMFPVWLGFRGGKGVATGVGVFVVLAPWATAFAAVLFVLIVWSTRYVSLGSIAAAMTFPFLVLLGGMLSHSIAFNTVIASMLGASLIVVAHRANIRRLVQGTESKFK